MTPGQQQRKDAQDAARRQQQADERIRELEKENERLRNALRQIRDVGPGPHIGTQIRNICDRALDGGGDADE